MPITDEDRPSNQLVLKLAGVRELQAARGVLGGRSRPGGQNDPRLGLARSVVAEQPATCFDGAVEGPDRFEDLALDP